MAEYETSCLPDAVQNLPGYQAGRPISCSLSAQPEPRKRQGCHRAVESLQHGGLLTIEYPQRPQRMVLR